jgi:hypothetical protein
LPSGVFLGLFSKSNYFGTIFVTAAEIGRIDRPGFFIIYFGLFDFFVRVSDVFYLLISYFAVSGRDILEPIPDTGLNDP